MRPSSAKEDPAPGIPDVHGGWDCLRLMLFEVVGFHHTEIEALKQIVLVESRAPAWLEPKTHCLPAGIQRDIGSVLR